MLRILKGSSPQRETNTQPQREQLPQQMFQFSKSLVLGDPVLPDATPHLSCYPAPRPDPSPGLRPSPPETRSILASPETQPNLI